MARILYVSQGYTTHDRRFLEKLAASSHSIWFLPFATDQTEYEARSVPQGIQRLPPLTNGPRFGPIDWAVSFMRFRRCIEEVNPDLIQAGPVQTGGFVAALSGFHPLLIMSWGSDVLTVPDKNRWLHWVTRFTLRRADMVLGDCTAVRDRVLSLTPLKPDQIVIFPWGVNLREFRPKPATLHLRQRLQWEKYRVIIATRSFETIHGPLVFLEAVRRVFARRLDVRVMMLGDGILKPQVVNFIQKHGMTDRIHLPGQVPQPLLPDYFNEADLYVSATYSDGSSISMLEAMACGLPVIVTDGYGNRDWVEPMVNGWLYPAGDAPALSAVVLEALANDEGLIKIGRVNLALARERADWEANFPHLLEAYDRLLALTSSTSENRDHAKV